MGAFPCHLGGEGVNTQERNEFGARSVSLVSFCHIQLCRHRGRKPRVGFNSEFGSPLGEQRLG